jgi:hypothetical protein
MALPMIDVTASDLGRLLASSFSQRSRELSLETARLALATATQRPPTATDSMHRGLGCSAHCGEPSATYFDLTDTPGCLCVGREVGAKMESSDGLGDDEVYRAHEIIVHGSSGGPTAGEQ